jgi:pimeloyl-ACP methyl ester carboxylesterase
VPDVPALHALRFGDHGSPVVFCHGLFGQGRNWTQIGKSLSASHRVTLLDLPDHGRSDWTPVDGGGWDYVAAADAVAAELDPADPVALVGHSMGGKVAMLTALRHPELVSRLCVVDVSPVAYEEAGEFPGYVEAMKGLDLRSISTRGQADEGLREAVPDDTVRAFLLQNLRRSDEDGTGWRWQMNLQGLGASLDALRGWPEDAVAEVPPYDGPVLWIAGAKADYVRPDFAEAMERHFPRVRKLTVKDAGHWVHSEQPEIFEQVLLRFLDG